MFKTFFLLALTVAFLAQTIPAWCGGITESFHISVYIPPHVMAVADNNLRVAPLSSNTPIVQTQTEIRNNRYVTVTSIVMP